MPEVEAKVILGSCSLLSEVEERLKALGAQLVEEKREVDTYYQHPCRNFAETDEALRVRVSSSGVEVTYKGPKTVVGGVKSRQEVTLKLREGNVAALLESLGFRPVAEVVKERRYYRLGSVVVTLDVVEGLGCFLEAEYAGGEGVDEAVRVVEEALRKLGVASMPRTTKSYLEMVLEARRS
ncbi:MAG: class IV adenylate cyclase [Thermoproteota archaeon]